MSIAAPDGAVAEAMIYADLPALIVGAADFIATLAREAIAAARPVHDRALRRQYAKTRL